MTLSWLEILSLIGTAQGILFFLLLFTRKANRLPNFFLAVFTLIIAGDCFEPIFFRSDFLPEQSYLKALWGGLVFLHGPLLYLYVKYLSDREARFQGLDLIHFAPALLALLLSIPDIISSPQDDTIWDLLAYELFFAQIFLYTGWSIRRLNKYQQGIRDSFSNLESISLKWLWLLVIFTLCIYVISFLSAHLILVYPGNYTTYLLNGLQISLILLVYLLSYKAITQPDLFSTASLRKENHRTDQKKYRTSSLQETEKMNYLEQLNTYMEKKRPYLNPQLSMDQVANDLGINRHQLSQVLNEKVGKNFYDYINTFRVQAFTEILKDPQKEHYTLLALAYESGFNSKTTFNTIFKKNTGMTPSQYKRTQI